MKTLALCAAFNFLIKIYFAFMTLIKYVTTFEWLMVADEGKGEGNSNDEPNGTMCS